MISPPIRDIVKGERHATRVARDARVRDYLRSAARPEILRTVLHRERRRFLARLVGAKWQSLGRRHAQPDWDDRFMVSRKFLSEIAILSERQVPTMFLFGEDEDLFEEFVRARDTDLGAILDTGQSSIEVATIPGRVHGFVHLHIQDGVVSKIKEWLQLHVHAKR